jgi:hypothetical protein
MCFACAWAKCVTMRDSAGSTLQGNFPSRRRLLQAAAGIGVGGVASALEPSTGFAQAVQSADAKADIVFRNGPVYTVNGGQVWARAVAVQGTRIVYVGGDAGAQGFVGPTTRVVDLRGRMLLPGFVEGHVRRWRPDESGGPSVGMRRRLFFTDETG